VQPRSDGEVRPVSADPAEAPDIRMNHYADPHDMKVMFAVMRRALDVVAAWPAHREIGPLLVPPALATMHGYVAGEPPKDACSRTSPGITRCCTNGETPSAMPGAGGSGRGQYWMSRA